MPMSDLDCDNDELTDSLTLEVNLPKKGVKDPLSTDVRGDGFGTSLIRFITNNFLTYKPRFNSLTKSNFFISETKRRRAVLPEEVGETVIRISKGSFHINISFQIRAILIWFHCLPQL